MTFQNNASKKIFRLVAVMCAIATASFSVAAGEQQPNIISLGEKGSEFEVHVFEPDDANATKTAVITVHGGGWRWGKAEWTYTAARKFAERGMTVIAVDYRLAQNGLTPIDAFQDVCQTLVWVRQNSERFGIKPDKVAAFGVSAGGHLSALAASKGCDNTQGSRQNGGPDLLMLWSPALDMEKDGWFKKLLQGRQSAAANSPVVQLHNPIVPTLVIQGEKDTLTPLAGAERFCAKAKQHSSACTLQVYPGVGHLLTRNLENQESDFDPDPVFVKMAYEALFAFLADNGYIEDSEARLTTTTSGE